MEKMREKTNSFSDENVLSEYFVGKFIKTFTWKLNSSKKVCYVFAYISISFHLEGPKHESAINNIIGAAYCIIYSCFVWIVWVECMRFFFASVFFVVFCSLARSTHNFIISFFFDRNHRRVTNKYPTNATQSRWQNKKRTTKGQQQTNAT